MTQLTIADTLQYLDGSWALTRAIADSRNAQTYAFDGRGEVLTREGHARYEEQGVLRHGAHESSARRALDLTRIEGGAVSVRFLDGRPFFDLDLTGGVSGAVHPCGLDRYELRFEVVSSDVLLEHWRVDGPSKSYEAETTWRRLRDGPMSQQ